MVVQVGCATARNATAKTNPKKTLRLTMNSVIFTKDSRVGGREVPFHYDPLYGLLHAVGYVGDFDFTLVNLVGLIVAVSGSDENARGADAGGGFDVGGFVADDEALLKIDAQLR